jgi:hypothetical protein
MLLRGIRHKAPDDRRPVPSHSGDAALRTASPTEADRLLCEESPVSSARARVESHVIGPIRGAFHEKDHMTTTIFLALALLAMSRRGGSVNMRQHFAKVSQHRGRR